MTASGDVGPRRVGVALRRLKRQGGLVFVTGPDGPAADLAVRRLFGSPDATRRRLLVLTDPGSGARVASDFGDFDVIDDRRAADDRGDDPADELRALRAELLDAIATYESAEQGLEPGALRIVIDSVDPLVEAWGVESVDSFLRTLAAIARGVRGLVGVRVRDPGPDEWASARRDHRLGADGWDADVPPSDAEAWVPTSESGDDTPATSAGTADGDTLDSEVDPDESASVGDDASTIRRGGTGVRRSPPSRGDASAQRSDGPSGDPTDRRPTGRHRVVTIFRRTADAWIEVRDEDGPIHRWHFPDVGRSAWVALGTD
jgi:hypothetical protein